MDQTTPKKTVPTFCYQCVAGPDLMRVEVEGGIATRIESNYSIGNEHPGGGRVCVKAYGLIQKTYNPDRVKTPMKRTNPKKGRDEDPGFVPISWDEALDTVAGKLRKAIDDGLTDTSGYPRIAASFGGGGTPTQYMGTFPAFLAALGNVDLGFGAGQGVKCYHSEHLYGELWHRAFIVAPDTPRVNYILSCGHNGDASTGVAGIWRHADARVRGMKRVQVEPHQSITGAVSAEWIPIKPKTDAAFLYGVIHRILHERDWRADCDIPFLKDDTVAPYLVGPNGYYLRDPETRKPLIHDLADGINKPFDGDISDAALEGSFTVSGIEVGADADEWSHDAIQARTAHQVLLDHMKPYDPEWAAAECDVPADRIRSVADEFIANACVGETIEIEGETLPFRPVAVLLGKTVNNGWGGYNCCWARTLLLCLVGALEVPGGMIGTNVKLNRPAYDRFTSAVKGPDGVMEFPFNATTKNEWQSQPHIRNAYRTLVPLVANSAWSSALGPAHLPWLFQKSPPKNWPEPTKPDIWFCYRTNPAISSWNTPEVTKRMAEFPFTVAFAYTYDETNHMADILLPEATDLESTQLIQIGGTKFVEQLWTHQGWTIRQPACETEVDCRDMTDIATELAVRTGILEPYNAAINKGGHGVRLATKDFDYRLDETQPHSLEEIWNASAKAASHDLSGGEEINDLDWFKEHGYMLRPFPQLDWYLYPHMKKNGIRFELPYQERILRHGTQLARRLHGIGVEWWDVQLEEYEPLPAYKPFPDIWTEHVREAGGDPDDFPLWALTSRSMQYSWGLNVGIPMINEVAQNVSGHKGLIINRGTAEGLGLAEGDPVVIQSVAGETRGYAVLREGIRPDTVVMIGQFDHWKTPFAKDLNLPSLNSLTSMSLSLTDSTGSGADIARVRVMRGDGPPRPEE
ncbi:MAG: molybdopterin-dependent oxidoreductase [Rhodospirillaceae bacterium]|nr:molybdopterin-dependent oxidoreductase [Rhodospirillaceae bacterium]MBT5178732.1 molybdopterin-dependent oxidoreductase [Rhodospirillaceae bacterium]MBT5840345.1 molybdopterin-dependent oxidoreductase [Rhodospirillaceae bacterium]MBT6291626.1 molybdopterin-dependent oxidoreductase [Rhodospirillaceae bacterium]MBT7235535.1 molybdopterin-dependent oxidoreductase [Rhodospirillaceae bacterium]